MVAIKENEERLKIEFKELWRLLIATTTDPGAGETIYVLDIFNECRQDDRDKLIKILQDFYTTFGSYSGAGLRLKFFIISRSYQEIELPFFKLIRNIPSIRLAGEEESEAISQEINIVMELLGDASLIIGTMFRISSEVNIVVTFVFIR